MYLCINYIVSTIINPENTAAGKYLQRELYVLRVPAAGALGQRGADVGRPRAGEGLVRAGQWLPLRSPASEPVCVPMSQAFARCCRAGPRPRRPSISPASAALP